MVEVEEVAEVLLEKEVVKWEGKAMRGEGKDEGWLEAD